MLKYIPTEIKSILEPNGINSFINAKTLETSGQIINLKNTTLSQLSTNALRLLNAGANLKTLYEEVKNTEQKNLQKSELVARNELKVFNSQLSDKRALNIGVKKAVWNAVGDERTRKCHKVRDNKEFSIEKGLYSSCDGEWLKPGQEINCRCFSTYILED